MQQMDVDGEPMPEAKRAIRAKRRPGSPGPRQRRHSARRNAVVPYMLITPTAIAVLLFTVIPLMYVVVISLQRNSVLSAQTPFIGLENYRRLLSDPVIWNSLRISAIFTVVSTVLSFLIGFGLALLLNQPLRGRGLMRALLVIPYATPSFVTALLWAWIYNNRFGILTAVLRQLGWHNPPVWLDFQHALWSMTAVMVWQEFPLQFIIILAGLQAMPLSLYEAASIDGASRFAQFRSITLPLLRPITMISILLAVINVFQFYTIPWILTQGGPADATNVIGIAVYQEGFMSGDFGYASSAAVLMFSCVLVIGLLYVRYYIRQMSNW